MRRLPLWLQIIAAFGSFATVPSHAAEADASSPQTTAVDVKKVFAASCSWCHDGYGMDAGKGPKLAGTQMTEQQIYDRIWNGKPGTMPAYKKTLSEVQVIALASYIKGLPAN